MAARKPGKAPDWSLSLMRYLTGQLEEHDLIAAGKAADPKQETENMCEAYFYIGSKHLIAGEAPIANDYFRKCVATDVKNFTEFASSIAEMDCLKASGGIRC